VPSSSELAWVKSFLKCLAARSLADPLAVDTLLTFSSVLAQVVF
jgi:hypothetical protein